MITAVQQPVVHIFILLLSSHTFMLAPGSETQHSTILDPPFTIKEIAGLTLNEKSYIIKVTCPPTLQPPP